MYNVILGILVVVTLFLGVRLFLKLREVSSARDDERVPRVPNARTAPRELLELKIEQPSAFDAVDDENNTKPRT